MTATLPDPVRACLELPPDVTPAHPGPADADTGPVLVTGVTGFFGAALLGELLARHPGRQVYCLVRPGDDAQTRLRQALDDAELWQDDWAGNVRAIAGDLALPAAGLAPADAELLRQEVSLIYHSGAFVNLTFPFDQVRAANVDGTVEMLRLAAGGRPKRLCHISTLSTVDIEARSGEELRDPAPLGPFDTMITGYAQSKWVAERLVEQAAGRGFDVRTMRLGALAGHSRTGVSNPNDYAWLVVCACLQIGAVPLMRAPTSWLPVDLVARAVLALTEMPAAQYAPYQVLPAGQITYADVFSWLRRAGYRLPTMGFPQWRERLRRAAADGSRAVQAISSVIPQAGLPGEAQSDVHSPRTEKLLADSGAPVPRLTESTFRTFLAAGARRGEIPAPSTTSQGMP